MEFNYSQPFPRYRVPESVSDLEKLPALMRRVVLFRELKIPRFFYRYAHLNPADAKSVERLRQVVLGSSLWLSSPQDFNDPYDMHCHVVFEGTGAEKRQVLLAKAKELDSLGLVGDGWKSRQRRVDLMMANPDKLLSGIRKSFKLVLNHAGVCCFTTNPRQLLMWSHYGKDHKGLALQFDPSGDPVTFTKPSRVSYSKELPVINWTEATYSGVLEVTHTKYEDWGYEDEWRMLHPRGCHTRHLFAAKALTGIIFGCRTPKEVKQMVVELLAERGRLGFPPVRLYQARMREAAYRLAIHKFSGEALGE